MHLSHGPLLGFDVRVNLCCHWVVIVGDSVWLLIGGVLFVSVWLVLVLATRVVD